MAWPDTPLDVVTEIYAGGWRNVSTLVRRADTITIDHGGGKPSECGLTLDNADGRFSARNPTSPYYPNLTRNTPIRVAARTARDTFGRTVSNGWGSTDTGQAWSTGGTGGTVQASDYGVDGDEGWLSVPVADASRYTYLAGEPYRDVDVTMTFRLSAADITGGWVQVAILFRGQSATEVHHAGLWINPTGEQGTIEIADLAGVIIAGDTLGAFTNLDTVPVHLRVQVEGRAARTRAWSSADEEPAEWQVTAVLDDDLAGWVGARLHVDTGNTNVPLLAYVDNLEVRVPLFAGRVASWPPEWGPSEATVWAKVQAGGTLQQVHQSGAVLASAPRRWIPTTGPVAYWPMESGSSVDALPALVGGHALKPFVGVHPSGAVVGSPKWGDGELAPWLPRVVGRTGSPTLTILRTRVHMPAFINTWTIDLYYNLGTVDDDMAVDVNPSYLGGSLGWPQLSLLAASSEVQVAFAGPETAATVRHLFDSQLHHVRWTCTQSGGNVNWSVAVDAITVLSGSEAMTLPAITTLALAGGGPTQGHLAVWTGPPAVSTAAQVAFGWRGETAGRRIERLCDEQGIDFLAHGDLDDTAAMGPQRLAPLGELLEDCETADAGVLFDSRAGGLAYRPASAVYNQPVSLALDYATRGHVAPPLTPVEDDRIANDVTVTRAYGLETQAEQASGPLSVLDPPDGVGRYAESVTAYLQTDDQATNLAYWRLHLGTWDEPRYTSLVVDLLALAGTGPAGYALALSAAGLGPMDRATVDNPPAWCGPTALDQLVAGTRMLVDEVAWSVHCDCVPAGAYQVFEVEHADLGRLHPDGATLAAGIDDNDMALSLATPAGKPVWTIDPADFPLDLEVLPDAATPVGEVMTVSVITGSVSPQTATVSARAVNGVSLSHAAGSVVQLASRHVIRY